MEKEKKTQIEIRFPSDKKAVLPFEKGEGYLMLNLKDNAGRTVHFLLDTGASKTIIFQRFLESEKAATPLTEEVGTAYGSHGKISSVPVPYQVKELRLGQVLVLNIPAFLMDLPNLEKQIGTEIHGILGSDVLENLVVLIDYCTSTVEFIAHVAAAKLLDNPAHTLSFTYNQERPFIEMSGRINGTIEVPFIFDTGSPFTFLNKTAAEVSGIEFNAEEDTPGLESCDQSGTPITLSAGQAKKLAFGTLEWQQVEVKLLDLPVFAQLGMAEKPAGVLGNDHMQGLRVAINYAESRIQIWPSEAS